MTELLPREKAAPGRRRTVTASAWVSRPAKRGAWKSHVYVGSGRVHVLSTGSNDRIKALDFNRCHLLQMLANKTPTAANVEEQRYLFEEENHKPSKPEDSGKWRYTLPGNPPEDAEVFWDERGFAAIYIDGCRQLPVHMLDDAKWERVSSMAPKP